MVWFNMVWAGHGDLPWGPLFKEARYPRSMALYLLDIRVYIYIYIYTCMYVLIRAYTYIHAYREYAVCSIECVVRSVAQRPVWCGIVWYGLEW